MNVVAAILTDGSRVLACRRRRGLADGGKWEFPGGKVEAGESDDAALERELAEELGLVIDVGARFDRSTTLVDGVPITLSCYFVRASGDAPSTSLDHDQVRWFPRNRLVWLDWSAPDLPSVRKLAFGLEY